jgi:hypothetical protein
LSDLAREAAALRRPDLLDLMVSPPSGDMAAPHHKKTTWSAIAAETEGRHAAALTGFQDAERGWKKFGDPFEQAHCLIGQAPLRVGAWPPEERSAAARRGPGTLRRSRSRTGGGGGRHAPATRRSWWLIAYQALPSGSELAASYLSQVSRSAAVAACRRDALVSAFS